MKKTICIVLGVVFIIFLALGIFLNGQRGLYYEDAFWILNRDGSFTNSGNHIVLLDDGSYELCFADSRIAAVPSALPDGGIRMDYSDGWAVERSAEDDFLYDFGGYAWGSNSTLILKDMDAADLRFAAVAQEERTPIHDANSGTIIGEAISLYSEDGEFLDYREDWFHEEQYSMPEPELIVLKDNTRIPEESLYNCILQNEDGEYLLDAHQFGRIPLGTTSTDRSSFTWFLMKIAEGGTVARGSGSAILWFVLLYGLGAAQMIWPEKLAFFGERWKFREEPQLSDAGLSAMYISSAVVMLISILMLFAGL